MEAISVAASRVARQVASSHPFIPCLSTAAALLLRSMRFLVLIIPIALWVEPAHAQLPTTIGWTALPTSTALLNSGACPPNNFGGDPFLFTEFCQNVIRTWNGAIADTTANRLIIWGGGHNNYYGNEIYSLNLTANPITITRLKDPTVPTNDSNSSNCIDGIPPGNPDFAPNSREDYGGLAFIPGPYRMLILNGSLGCLLGNGSFNTWSISLSNLSNSTSWVHENPTLTGPQPGLNGGDPYGTVSDFDPNSGLVFIMDSAAMYTYNYATNTYTMITPRERFVTDIYLSGAIDPTRKLFVMVGNCGGGTCNPGDGVFVADISNPASTTQQNWTAATMADPNCAEFLSGGVNPISAANPGIAFDSVANDFVGWPNQGNSVYIMTPDAVNKRLTCQKLTFANGPPNSSHANNQPNTSYGTFGRFRYFAALDAFVLVNDANIPPYILRLRSSTAPDFTLTANPSTAPVNPGGTATYTVNVGSLNGFSGSVNLAVTGGLPSGTTASFSPASVTAPGSSTLTITTATNTPSGSPTLTITGTSGSLIHTANVTLDVTDFTLKATPSSAAVSPGGTATYTINVGALNGFGGLVNLAVTSGLPSGATPSFSPASITGSGNSTLTITTTTSTPTGSPTLTITGTSASLTHTATVVLNVTPSDFTLTASPGMVSVAPGGKATYTATVAAVGTFNGSVSLMASGLPSGATASFVPASITGSGSSTMTITTTTSTPPGRSTLTITGSSGSLVHSANVILTITSTNPATVKFVQSNYADPQGSVSSVNVTFTAAQSAGDLIVVAIAWFDTTTQVSSLTDSMGNTYTQAVGPTSVGGAEPVGASIYYAKNIAAAAANGNTVAVTFNDAAFFPDVRILEYSGANLTSPLDVVAANSGTNSPTNSGLATTTNANDLVLGASAVWTSNAGPGNGFTMRILTQPDHDIVEDEMVTTTGSYSATAPLNVSGPWVMQLVAFKAQ